MSGGELEGVLADLDSLVRAQTDATAERVSSDGKLSRRALDAAQPEAFELARSLAELEAARAAVRHAARTGSYESDLAAVFVGSAARAICARVRTGACAGAAGAGEALARAEAFARAALATESLSRIGAALVARSGDWAGDSGLDADHSEVRSLFARVADEKVAPVAGRIHAEDMQIPTSLLREYAELGVFGISIPESYGGSFVDHLTMCLATEELSRASVGAGGSVITRPEIAAKAILRGGTDEQKRTWLPRIAAGKRLVCVAVTEPNAGSDVANVRVSARRTEGGYLINGEKTWATFAGRADVFALLARTGPADSGYRGLTLFLVEKPGWKEGEDEYAFRHVQPGGGSCEGHAIPTIGYRGMHSFGVSFEDWFVPEGNRIGAEGDGFKLQMQGFAGGRIQTAARAVGVMEAALRAGVSYARDRRVFGSPLASFSMPASRLVLMAATVMACRQLLYAVAGLMDEEKGAMEASLVKLLSCREAEWVTRDAMQLHGGMGYSEEYAVSRYFVDARVLSIFEGAEEVLGIHVVARQVLRERLAGETD